MKSIYSRQEFGQLIGRKTKTLQRWDREGKLRAHRSPTTNRRYYTHDQCLQYRGLSAQEQGLTTFALKLHGLRSYKKVIKDAALQKD